MLDVDILDDQARGVDARYAMSAFVPHLDVSDHDIGKAIDHDGGSIGA